MHNGSLHVHDCVMECTCLGFNMYNCNGLEESTCWPLPSNQSFYRQIAGYVRGVRDSRVGKG